MLFCSRQGVLRPAPSARRAGQRRRRDRADRAALPVPARGVRRADRTSIAAAKSVVWCQEEPGNQGAWHRIQHYLQRHLRADQAARLRAGASPSASPAVGYLAHAQRAAEGAGRRGADARRRGDPQEGRRLTRRRTQGNAMQVEVKVPQLSGVRLRSHAGRLAQEGRRGGQARREPDRHRDRQGRAGAAARPPTACSRRSCKADGALVDERRGDRHDRHRAQGRQAPPRPPARPRPPPRRRRPPPARRRGLGRGRRPAAAKIAAEKGVDTGPVRRHRPRRSRDQGRRAGRRSGARRHPRRPPRQAGCPARAIPPASAPSSACRCRGCAPRIAERLRAVAVHRRHPHDVQRSQHAAGHGAAQPLQGQVREEARREARLHVLLREGRGRRAAASSRW